MKRIVVFRNGCAVNGKVINVIHSHSMSDVLQCCSQKLAIPVKLLYTPQGGLVDDTSLFKDDDTIYASSGEPFKAPPSCSSKRLSDSDVTVPQSPAGDWIRLNVGGRYFTTTRTTLVNKHPMSMLARMFGGGVGDDGGDNDEVTQGVTWPNSVDSSGAYLIDRSPEYFEPILNFLRHGVLVLDKHINPKGVLQEAKFYGLDSVVELLDQMAAESESPTDEQVPLTRRDVVAALISSSTSCELRFQGVDLSGADLSKLDLRYINFKMADLRGTNLSSCNLTCCTLERADLREAILDGATLLGAKLLRANVEGASLKGCNFDDPAGSHANMEGVNLRGANMSGCQMANVNLRVANLRNANMANCDLRGAVLAGADLENCDLSGCDLQSANLRGANLVGVDFHRMITPLHPTQTTSARARPRPDSLLSDDR